MTGHRVRTVEEIVRNQLIYSDWHRWDSIIRFIRDESVAKGLTMCDIDEIKYYCEYHKKYKTPLFLVETACCEKYWAPDKKNYVIRKVSRYADIPMVTVLFKPSEEMNRTNGGNIPDIKKFRVKGDFPDLLIKGWQEYDPQEYAEFLVRLRDWGINYARKRERMP